jgi:hypothetical protein
MITTNRLKILKYVINDDNLPILFCKSFSHSAIITNVVSAGYVIIDFDISKQFFLVKVYGASSSLGISSRLKDDEIIEKHLNGCTYLEKEVLGLPQSY